MTGSASARTCEAVLRVVESVCEERGRCTVSDVQRQLGLADYPVRAALAMLERADAISSRYEPDMRPRMYYAHPRGARTPEQIARASCAIQRALNGRHI